MAVQNPHFLISLKQKLTNIYLTIKTISEIIQFANHFGFFFGGGQNDEREHLCNMKPLSRRSRLSRSLALQAQLPPPSLSLTAGWLAAAIV